MSVMCLVFLLPLDFNDRIPTVSRCVVWFDVFIIDTVFCIVFTTDVILAMDTLGTPLKVAFVIVSGIERFSEIFS